jgi:hypothetical protein
VARTCRQLNAFARLAAALDGATRSWNLFQTMSIVVLSS